MAHQSLYRRYRPRRFAEVKGQEHVVRALRNAVSDDTAGHAYLFSGPRGTGKTSTARILAKALNCTNLADGEPCCECESCVAMEAGGSFDLFELDAASNRGVDSVRDLVERTAVGSPGRTKVYILDEVHMLTKEASNALLKTLEEPPEHVRFVLATTDPQKVLPTIRSRTQHFDFNLLSAVELTEHVRWVSQDAGLDVDEDAIAFAVRRGRGSVRDTLSALDQVVAAGGVIQRGEPVDALFEAIAARDSGKALLAVAEAVNEGHDPRVLAEAFVAEVRDAFLVSLGVDTPHLIDTDAQRLGHWVNELGRAGLTSSLERVGSALVDMRQAADPRVPLEVALVQLTTTESNAPEGGVPADDVVAALVKRIERLEADRSNSPRRSTETPSAASDPAAAPPSGSGTATGGASAARAALADARGADSDPPRASQSAPQPKPEAGPESAPKPAPSKDAAPARSAEPQRGGRRKPPPPPPRRRGGADRSAPTPGEPNVPSAPAPAAPAPAAPDPRLDEASTVGAEVSGAEIPRPPKGDLPDRDALALAFGDVVAPQLKGVAKAMFGAGRFVSADSRGAVFALDNGPTRDRAEKYRSEIESRLSEHFGVAVALVLVTEAEVDSGSPVPAAGVPSESSTDRGAEPVAEGPPSTAQESAGPVAGSGVGPAEIRDEEDLTAPVDELEDADVGTSGLERVAAAFPGAELIDTEDPK